MCEQWKTNYFEVPSVKNLNKMSRMEEQTALLDSLSTDEFKEKLRELGLPSKGSKAVLKERLKKAWMEDATKTSGKNDCEDATRMRGQKDDQVDDLQNDGNDDQDEEEDEDVDINSLTVKELRFRLRRLG